MKKILFFGRKGCRRSAILFQYLKKKSNTKVTLIQSNFLGETLNIKRLDNNYDYIFCFRSFYILRKNVLDKINFAAINFHPGPPEYRGTGCINYALYNEVKKYGCTAHIMNNHVDFGKILNVRRFTVKKKDTVETVLMKTYTHMEIQAKKVINLLIKDPKNLEKLINKSKKEKWSKKNYKKNDLDKFYEIKKNISRKDIIKKIRATNTKKFKPYLLIHKHKFTYNK